MSEVKNMDDLRWVRIFTPLHIPKYLVEQIKHRDWSVEDFYKYQQTNCLIEDEAGPSLNPFYHLYVLVNEENVTKGFLWFTVEPLTKDIHIQNYSVDKEYWGKGRAVEKLSNHIKFIRKKANLNKVYWITNYPKHSEKHGFKRSKSVLMEYSEGNSHGKDIQGRNLSQRQCEHAEQGSTRILEGSSGGDGADVTRELSPAITTL